MREKLHGKQSWNMVLAFGESKALYLYREMKPSPCPSMSFTQLAN
jgi:hypothetical protein